MAAFGLKAEVTNLMAASWRSLRRSANDKKRDVPPTVWRELTTSSISTEFSLVMPH